MAKKGKQIFITTKYRVRPGVQTLIKFLEWKELCKSEDSFNKYFLDSIVHENLILLKMGKISVKRDSYRNRKDVSLTFKENTINEINTFYKTLKTYKGELIEICLFIYSIQHLSEAERQLNGLHLWELEITFN